MYFVTMRTGIHTIEYVQSEMGNLNANVEFSLVRVDVPQNAEMTHRITIITTRDLIADEYRRIDSMTHANGTTKND